jgi:hypothetical protein
MTMQLRPSALEKDFRSGGGARLPLLVAEPFRLGARHPPSLAGRALRNLIVQLHRRTTLTVIAAAAFAVLVGAAPARAQTASTEIPQPQAPGWVFTPSLSLGGSWDDNVLLVGGIDNPPEDYGTPIGSNLALNYRGRKFQLESGYIASFMRYRTLDQFDSSDQRLSVALHHRATSRITLLADENFTQAPTTDGLNLVGVPFIRIGSRTNDAGGGVEIALARHTMLVGKYGLHFVSFDKRPGVSLQDGYEHTATLDLEQARSPRLTVGAKYELRREVLSDGDDRFNIHSGGATIKYALTQTLTASGLLGIEVLESGLNFSGRTGPAVEADLTYRARETVLTAAYQRTFVPAFGFGGTFQNQQWLGKARLPIVGRLYVEGDVNRSGNEPLAVGQPSLLTLWFSTTLGYHASRWLVVEAYANRTQQETQGLGGTLHRNQVGFRVAVTKPMRIR